jgi:inorganic pyrophosphatase
VKIFVQNEAGSFVRNSFDEKGLKLKRAARVSRPYPFPYGFVLNTTGEDGLNVDCFILTKTILLTGQIVECDAIGLMEQYEDGKADHNVLAVIRGEDWPLDDFTKAKLTEFVSHVFDHLCEKTIRVGRFLDAASAEDFVTHCRD